MEILIKNQTKQNIEKIIDDFGGVMLELQLITNSSEQTETATGVVLQNQLFLKFSQNSQENTYVGVSF